MLILEREIIPMHILPRVTERIREQVAREFDDLGPEMCVAEITHSLEAANPELLEMAGKWAHDIGEPGKLMTGFGMFYRLLTAQSAADLGHSTLSPLPRVTPHARDTVVGEIDQSGPEAFTIEAIEELDRTNPELLQMAHFFASQQQDYLKVMQGFALFYRSLLVQSAADRSLLH